MATMFEFVRQHWKRLFLGLLLLVGMVIFLYKKLQPEGVPAVQLKREDIVASLTVTGEVKTLAYGDISAPVSARIEGITVDKGDVVSPGQVLVVLDQSAVLARLSEAQSRLGQAQAALQHVQEGSRPEEILRLEAAVQEARNAIQQQQAAVESAQATLNQAKSEVNRYESLFQEGLVSRQEYDQEVLRAQTAQAQLNQAQATLRAAGTRVSQFQQQLQQARAGATASEIREAQAARDAAASAVNAVASELSDRTLRSKISGVVTDRLKEPGEIAAPGQPIVRLVNKNLLRVEANVEEADVSKIGVSDPASVILDAYPSTPIPGRIQSIGGEVNPENGTVRVLVGLQPPAEVQLLPGMTADVNIVTARLRQVLVLPASAVREQNGKTIVFRFQDKQIVQQPVVAKRIDLEHFQVLSGLKSGDWVALEADEKWLKGKRKTPQPVESGSKS